MRDCVGPLGNRENFSGRLVTSSPVWETIRVLGKD